MIESEVVKAFVAWLNREGWSVQTGVDFVDVVGERDGVELLAEAKGTTSSVGLDVDTGYGQILRRLSPEKMRDGTRWLCPLLLARQLSV